MAVQTGRTTYKHTNFIIGDSGNATLRAIPIDSLSACGVVYDEQDIFAFQDAVHGKLPTMPDAPVDITGPFDTSAATTVALGLSGSHTVLYNLAGALTPLTLDIQCGIRHAWEAGEPQFGITATATAGYLCTKYTVDLASMKYAASFRVFAGSTLPAWGTAAETT